MIRFVLKAGETHAAGICQRVRWSVTPLLLNKTRLQKPIRRPFEYPWSVQANLWKWPETLKGSGLGGDSCSPAQQRRVSTETDEQTSGYFPIQPCSFTCLFHVSSKYGTPKLNIPDLDNTSRRWDHHWYWVAKASRIQRNVPPTCMSTTRKWFGNVESRIDPDCDGTLQPLLQLLHSHGQGLARYKNNYMHDGRIKWDDDSHYTRCANNIIRFLFWWCYFFIA